MHQQSNQLNAHIPVKILIHSFILISTPGGVF